MLLITNARCDVSGRAYISLLASSYVDIDPLFEDADWLRSYTQRMARHQHVNPTFAKEGPPLTSLSLYAKLTRAVFKYEQWLESDMKALFHLSDVDELWVIRSHP